MILEKFKIQFFDSDVRFITRLTLNHAGSEYIARVYSFSYRNSSRVTICKNAEKMADYNTEKCSSVVVSHVKKIILALAGRDDLLAKLEAVMKKLDPLAGEAAYAELKAKLDAELAACTQP